MELSPPVIIIAAVAAFGILLVTAGIAGGRRVDPVQARLSQLGTVQVSSLEELELQQPLFERTLRPLAQRLAGVVRRFTSSSQVGRTERRLAMAGNPGNMGTSEFLGVKAVVALISAVVAFAILSIVGQNPMFGIVMGVLGVGIGFMAPEFWLGRRIKGRQRQILRTIPDTLDLLTISVRAGLGFDAALGKVTEKMRGPLPEEFRRGLAEIRMGKTRREALRAIVARTEVPALTNFIGAIIQAEQLGVSISKVLQVQSEQLRIERRQRAEELAAKAPIKMLLPLVGCIFPSLFVVILGPAIILIMTNLVGV
jgi:tight adherence protein C